MVMALKAVHVSDVPNLVHVPDHSISTSHVPKRVEIGRRGSKPVVIGHRGKGMNLLSSPDPRMKAVKENSVISFNEAGRFPIDFVEFDVQDLGTVFSELARASRDERSNIFEIIADDSPRFRAACPGESRAGPRSPPTEV